MLRIAACDDEKELVARLRLDVAWALSGLKLAHEIHTYHSAEELCRKLEDGEGYDLIFLDIQFAKNEIDGVQAGARIREEYENNHVSIVYISWEKDYAFDLVDINPLRFLIKPLTREEIEKTLKKHLKIKGFSSGRFSYKKGRDTVSTWTKDIVYFEARDRKTYITFADGTKDDFYGALREVYDAQIKSGDFLFIHASYLVNYDYVIDIKYDRLLIQGGVSLPISRNRRIDVRQRYATITQQRRFV